MNEKLWMNGAIGILCFLLWIFLPARLFLIMSLGNIFYFSIGNIYIIYDIISKKKRKGGRLNE